jgi:predicted aldo/keto reductase-like oxidoreductase
VFRRMHVLTLAARGVCSRTSAMDHCVSQIQHNYLDVEYQAGTKGLAVVIMEPLRGGALARNIPPAVQALWDSYDEPCRKLEAFGKVPRRAPADRALQWLWNQPEVSLVLSGMSTMEQVEENLASAGRSGVGTMTGEELALVVQAREAYQALCAIPCTACKYCLPCPQGVAIPDVFEVYNDLLMFGDEARSRMFYSWLDEKSRADACIECGECLEKGPQGIQIPDWMKKVHEALGQQK